MKNIFIALALLVVINLLAVGAGVGWLAATDRLSEERVREVISIFEPTIAEEEAEAERLAMEAEQAAEVQAEAVRMIAVADGPKTHEERLVDTWRADEVAAQRIERLKREREDILRQIAAAKAVIARQREEIVAAEQAFVDRVEAYQQQREGDDFKQAVSMLEQLKPKQAKAVFQDMLAAGDQETAVAYLAEMNQRKAGAVLREFKQGAELMQAKMLIEALRLRGEQILDGADDQA